MEFDLATLLDIDVVQTGWQWAIWAVFATVNNGYTLGGRVKVWTVTPGKMGPWPKTGTTGRTRDNPLFIKCKCFWVGLKQCDAVND